MPKILSQSFKSRLSGNPQKRGPKDAKTMPENTCYKKLETALKKSLTFYTPQNLRPSQEKTLSPSSPCQSPGALSSLSTVRAQNRSRPALCAQCHPPEGTNPLRARRATAAPCAATAVTGCCRHRRGEHASTTELCLMLLQRIGFASSSHTWESTWGTTRARGLEELVCSTPDN